MVIMCAHEVIIWYQQKNPPRKSVRAPSVVFPENSRSLWPPDPLVFLIKLPSVSLAGLRWVWHLQLK